ncbi:MAG: hypothetical protein KTR25_09060 [Myxococcales bacterium]|nr:hypothetical protein [Myxococcales bacterium]
MKSSHSYKSLKALVDRFSPEELLGQFVLSRGAPNSDWPCFRIGDWNLAVESMLACIPITSNNEVVGWLLGQAIGPDHRVVVDSLEIPPDRVEETIYAHGGRFIVILPLAQRIYLDPCGLLPAVFCEHLKLVSSTPSLIPYEGQTQDREQLIRSLGITERNAMFPVGMTSRKGIEGVLPNHYLDLKTWKIVRHWPNQSLEPIEDITSAVHEIADLVKQQIEATTTHRPATLRLTAGKHSRMLLACARGVVHSMECWTAELRDFASILDCDIAKRVSARAGVTYRSITFIEPDEQDLALWLFRTGLGTGEYRGRQLLTTLRKELDPTRADIVGFAGEIARGFYWEAKDTPSTNIRSQRLLRHCCCPLTSETLERMECWRANASSQVIDALQLLDLFYIEQRLGCWAGILTYAGMVHSPHQAFPLSHRRIVELMLRLPADYRRSGQLPVDIIAREWPVLLKYPFNTPIDFSLWAKGSRMKLQELIMRVQRTIRDPRRLYAKLVGY